MQLLDLLVWQHIEELDGRMARKTHVVLRPGYGMNGKRVGVRRR